MRVELVGNRYNQDHLDHIRHTKPEQITNEFRPSTKYAIYLKPDGLYQWEEGGWPHFPQPLEDLLQSVKARYGGYLAKLMREAVYEALDEAEDLKEALTSAQRERRNDDRNGQANTETYGSQPKAAPASERPS